MLPAQHRDSNPTAGPNPAEHDWSLGPKFTGSAVLGVVFGKLRCDTSHAKQQTSGRPSQRRSQCRPGLKD